MRLLQGLCVALLVFTISAEVEARPAIDPAVQTEINALYDGLLQNPTDRSLNLRYSATLSKAGDYEAAIPPLERILVNEPHNAWLMTQLAVLYNALNAKLMARTYLKRALAEPDISAEVAQKARALLATL